LDEDIALTVEEKLGAGHDSPGEGINDLMAELGRMGIGPDRVSARELLDLGSNTEITEHLQHLADQLLEEKEQEVGSEAWAQIERFVLLRTIDTLWVEHLTELDDMRRGIGLRGYSQQDPLNEFKKEAFGLYDELTGFIRHQVAATIFRVQIQPQQPQPPAGVFAMPGPGQPGANGGRVAAGSTASGAAALAGAATGGSATGTSGTAGTVRLSAPTGSAAGRGNGNGSGGSGARRPAQVLSGGSATAGGGAGPAGRFGADAQARPGYTPSGDKIGRNDACWCGSGLKYKKCHGR
ncbi:MAG TPA: SEC-C metal-binding domain-containing protein, partial [Candidatus Limnocylindrales bacterium]